MVTPEVIRLNAGVWLLLTYASSSSSVDVSDLLYGTSYDSKGEDKVNIFEVSVGNRAA